MVTEHDLSKFDPHQLNQVAGLLIALHDFFLPLDVRYQAAADALARVREWHDSRPISAPAKQGDTRE